MKFLLALIFIFQLASNISLAQATLTLEEAESRAAKLNPNLQRAEEMVEAASWKKLEALSGHLPHIQLRGQHIFGQQYERMMVNFGGQVIDFPAGMPQTTADIEATLNIFDGLSTLNHYAAARLAFDAAVAQRDDLKFRTDQGIKSLYYRALAAQQLLEVAEQNIKSLQDHMQLAKANVRSGFGTRFDVLRISSQLEEAQAERVLSQDNVFIAKKNLAQAMGEDNPEFSALQGELPTPNPKSVQADLNLDVQSRKDLRAQDLREQAAEKESNAAKGFWFPQVSLFAATTWYKFGSFDPAILPTDFQNAYSYGVRLTWNLFDGGASIAKSQESYHQSLAAQKETHDLNMKASTDFETSKRRFSYNTTLYQARLRSVEESEESVRLAKIGLRAGTRTHTEVLDAELSLFRTRAGVVQAQLDATESRINLENAVGRSL
jgi:outer membrane protein TolC